MHEVLANCLFKFAQEKSVVRSTDRPAMTITVDLGRKATKNKKKKETKKIFFNTFACCQDYIKGSNSLGCFKV